jgi:hypothetical protein
MKWEHYTNEEVVLKRCEQDNETLKPIGLWFAQNKDWLKWCECEEFASYKHYYEIDEVPKNILKINTVEEAKELCKNYVLEGNRIDWIKVAEKYDGAFLKSFNLRSFPDMFSTPGALIFCALDVDSLVIWNQKDLKITLS